MEKLVDLISEHHLLFSFCVLPIICITIATICALLAVRSKVNATISDEFVWLKLFPGSKISIGGGVYMICNCKYADGKFTFEATACRADNES